MQQGASIVGGKAREARAVQSHARAWEETNIRENVPGNFHRCKYIPWTCESLKPGQQWLTQAFCLFTLKDHITASLTPCFLTRCNNGLALYQGQQQVCVFVVERIRGRWEEVVRGRMSGGELDKTTVRLTSKDRLTYSLTDLALITLKKMQLKNTDAKQISQKKTQRPKHNLSSTEPGSDRQRMNLR